MRFYFFHSSSFRNDVHLFISGVCFFMHIGSSSSPFFFSLSLRFVCCWLFLLLLLLLPLRMLKSRTERRTSSHKSIASLLPLNLSNDYFQFLSSPFHHILENKIDEEIREKTTTERTRAHPGASTDQFRQVPNATRHVPWTSLYYYHRRLWRVILCTMNDKRRRQAAHDDSVRPLRRLFRLLSFVRFVVLQWRILSRRTRRALVKCHTRTRCE